MRRPLGFFLGPLLLALVFFGGVHAAAAETLPPVPENHFNDYAGLVPTAVATRLNERLSENERATSNQILVVVYPTMTSDSSIEDFTVRVAASWRAGAKGRDNAAILFVFSREHKLFIQVGYGLEGALPDVVCKRIVADEITPAFKRGDYAGGLEAGVNAMIAATRGEYKSAGRTGADQGSGAGIPMPVLIIVFVIVIAFSAIRGGRRGPMIYGGRRGLGYGGTTWGGNRGSRGGGTFSAGGGRFGGGGAGGSW